MQKVNWSHLFLQDGVESSCESASRNLPFPVSFPETNFNITSDTGREPYFIFASDVLKHSNTNTVAAMFGSGKRGKERSREHTGFVLEVV